jgi:hypothetical protein
VSTVPSVSDDAVHPNKLRIHLAQRNGTFRTLAQVMFTSRDASLYLVPYARSGNYFYGAQSIQPGQSNFEVKFKEHVMASARPKLSIHESGDVHIYADDSPKAGPINVRPVSECRGEHIAAVQFDHINLVPVYSRKMRITRGGPGAGPLTRTSGIAP